MPVKNIISGQKVTKEKPQRAKELRREMTPAEKILWQEVRAKQRRMDIELTIVRSYHTHTRLRFLQFRHCHRPQLHT